MKILSLMFSRKWILTTLLVIAACAVMARLGIWQLDRLEQRRAFNARVLAQLDAPGFQLDEDAFALDLVNMEYREVFVTGTFIPEEEIVLRNQVYQGQPGYHLLTPLEISGTGTVVLIDRGFIPSDGYTPGDWEAYLVPGQVSIHGILRRSQAEPDFGGRADPTPPSGERLQVWNLVNVEQVAAQLAEPVLPIYVQEKPLEGESAGLIKYPAPFVQELELTEGPHLGYAVQWFLFAVVLATGYPFFIRRETAAESQPDPAASKTEREPS